jgi:iron complex transport system permease protein
MPFAPVPVPASGYVPASRSALRLTGLALCLLAVAAAAVGIGTYPVSLLEIVRALGSRLGLGGPADTSVAAAVVWNLRLPRVLLAALVGIGLATSGAVFQASFRNPLVEPYILGVSSGAAFGAGLGVVLPQFPLSVPLAAFLGALAAVGLVHLLAGSRGDAPVVTLVLSGVIVGSMFAAGVSLLKYLADDAALREIVFWLLGGFYFATWSDVSVVAPIVLVSAGVMAVAGWRLNVLAMGDHEAQSLGIDPRRSRRVVLAAATVATAVAVSAVGIVPWVGLMVPHAARILLGPDNRVVVPGSALIGAIFLLVCDTAARSLTSSEIPVGIVTALAGGPFLAYLVRQRMAGIFG